MPEPIAPISDKPDPSPHDYLPHDQSRARRPPTFKRLRRSRDRVVAGVAGGVAEYIGARPTAVRWVFAVVIVLSGGVFLVAYALLTLLLPAAQGEP